MLAFNRDQMRTQNDEEGELFKKTGLKQLKAQAKKELKEAEQRLRHQIKYCTVPAGVAEELALRYKAGMTTRDLKRTNKYERYPHIAKILPTKRAIDQNTVKMAAQRMEA